MPSFDPKRQTGPFTALIKLTQPGQFQLLKSLRHSNGNGPAASVIRIDADTVLAYLHDPDVLCGRGMLLEEEMELA